MALQPDGEQLAVGPRVGVQRGQPIDLGTEDFGGGRCDDLKLRSSHLVTLVLPISEIISSALALLREVKLHVIAAS